MGKDAEAHLEYVDLKCLLDVYQGVQQEMGSLSGDHGGDLGLEV